MNAIKFIQQHGVDKCVGRTCIRVSNIARKETFLQHQNLFRKATGEEIAAGHRIDCEILDHPEDYTPPNCKKFDEQVK
ncbi:hypothetical protein [Acinetobacter higginsii]|uniref:hypothetical protein n=1 Tax=Acinetobacter higginsii TaxID=70347 RepID=UPI0030089976